jgi:LDH2 family malate/lactate/ureidoglycolate dehydrogenase
MTASVVLSELQLRDFSQRILEAAGVPPPKAHQVALALTAANLRGVDSHGVQLLPHYVDQIEAGDVDPHAEGHVISESGACLLYDAEHGLGHVTSQICCAHAVRLAAQHGISIVVAREASHFGPAAIWSQRISAAGYIGIVMCDASPAVPPWQGKQGRLGTNPISVSVPNPGGKGWLLDMATSTVSYGRLEKAALEDQQTIPVGWALDREGRPTTDLDTALKGFLMPLGGYKGSGLAMMVEILCGVLGGGAMSLEIRGIRQHGRHSRVNHAFLAIDVARFLLPEDFHARMERLVEQVKSAAPAAGYDEVLVAGDPEWRAEEDRRRSGIPIPPGPWEALVRTAARLSVPLPQVE